jgi:hypothetical protein
MKAVIIQNYKYIVLVLIVLSLQYKSFSSNMDRIRDKSLFGDSDGYWHLLRVQEIHNSGSWDNEINFRGNAPFGERIHWTHAMDIVLFGGAYIGSFFTDFDSSLYWFGVLVGPLLYVLSLVAIIFLGRAVLGPRHGVYLALLFAVNPSQVFVVYAVNRPDHHCLVGFLYILYYFSFILLLKRPGATVLAALTGMLGALALWSGLELLILLGLSVLYLGILWIINGDEYLNVNFILTLALSICISITLLIDEKPGNYWAIAYDKRSIVHVTLFVAIMSYWLTVILLARFGVGKGIGSRLMIAIGGGALLLFVCLCLYPEIVNGPLAKVDPRLHALYLDRTDEFGADPNLIVPNFLLLGPGLIYLVCAVRKAAKERRIVFSWLILAICVYSVVASTMNRWVYTLGVISLLPNALILIAISKWENTAKNAVLSLLITFSLLFVPLLATRVLSPSTETTHKKYESRVVDMLSFLESQDRTTARETVLANIAIGPAIMYLTSFNVIGTMNHNNDKGIIDTYYILNAEDDSTANALIEARGIDYLLIDDQLKMFSRFRMDPSGGSESPPVNGKFIDRLMNGQIPDWLASVPLPEGLAGTFWLYRVVGKDVKGG